MKGLLIICIMLTIPVFGQQTEQYTQYMFNQFGVNPAFAGIKECIDIRLGYRTQWVGFEGAPRTSLVNANGRILQRKTNYKYKHGVGVNALSDATGPTSRTFFNLAYAYHMPMNRKFNLSMGIAAGFLQYRFDESRITLVTQDDDAISGSRSKFLLPDINAGLLLYHESFYAGLTLKQVWRNKLKSVFPDSRLTHHYSLNIGKKFIGENDISYVPSIMIKFTRLSVPALDLNFMVDFKQNLAVGLSYRNTDAIAGLIKFNFLQRFSLGYSFDFTTSKIRLGSSNTHEIMLGIYSCPIKSTHNYECPVF